MSNASVENINNAVTAVASTISNTVSNVNKAVANNSVSTTTIVIAVIVLCLCSSSAAALLAYAFEVWPFSKTTTALAPVGQPPSTRCSFANGSVPRCASDYKIYKIENGMKRHYPNETTYRKYPSDIKLQKDVDCNELNKCPNGPPMP